MNIQKLNTTAYHPQTNGLTERFNHTLAQMLSMYVADNQKDWDVYLPYVLFAYRTTVHETMQEQPFKLLYGREARLPIDVMLWNKDQNIILANTEQEYIQELNKGLRIMQELAKTNLQKKQTLVERSEDNIKRKFDVGDEVAIYVPRVMKGRSVKLAHMWQGPFQIIQKIND